MIKKYATVDRINRANLAQICLIASILATICYLLFAFLAYLRYSLPYSPITNWLSDLGNPDLNPGGALLYNLGIILTALLLVPFFIGLSTWKLREKRVQVIMLRLTQTFGVLGAVCMLLSAIFPINNFEIHAFWSTSLYIMLSTAFIFSVAMLRYHHNVPIWTLIFGVSTGVVVILTSFFQAVYILEWVTILLYLVYIIILGVRTKKYSLSM
jgi:hypothetical membrane protein